MIRRIASIAALLSLCALAFLAYTSPAPYAMPDRRFVEPGRDFAPVTPTRAGDPRRVVVLVFDGLSPAAVRAADTPHLDRMAREGASTLAMMPEFPTLSLPNHFSLATGCRPARHGVVSNHFLDPDRGIYNAKGDADWLEECQLLHEVAEAQGVRSAVFGAVGNSSSTRGRLATVAEPFRVPPRSAAEQTDRVLAVLEERPDVALVVAYSTEPDESGHAFGPTAPETLAATAEVDAQIGRVLAAVDAQGLADDVTVIVTTDHGMVDVVGMLNLDGIVRQAGVSARVVGSGVMGHLHLDEPGRVDEARAALAGGAHYDVIDPADPPPGLHVGPSDRVGDLVIVPHAGYWIADLAHFPWFLRWSSFVSGEVIESARFQGMHGYDPRDVPGVQAVFFAWGGDTRAGVALDGMRSIDVHPTVAAMLGIAPGQPVDGRAHPALGSSARP